MSKSEVDIDWRPTLASVAKEAWPRLTWRRGQTEAYRVSRLDGRAMPGQTTYLTVKDLLIQENVIINGESGAGKSTFLGWAKAEMDALEYPWVIVGGPHRSYLELSESFPMSARELWGILFRLFEDTTNTYKRSNVLLDLEETLEPILEDSTLAGVCLIFPNVAEMSRDLMFEADELGFMEALYTGFRRFSERKRRPNFRTTILVTSEAIEHKLLVRSGFYHVSHQYLLSEFDVTECGLFLEECRLEPEVDGLEAVMSLVGGQPELLRRCCQQLRQLLGPGTLTSVDIRRAANSLVFPKKSGWAYHLKRLVENHPNLGARMWHYVKWISRSNPDASEYELFTHGWIRPDEEGNWRIRSKVHADMGRSILRELSIPEYS